MDVRFLIAGDRAVSVEFGKVICLEANEKVRMLEEKLKESPIDGVVEVVPTYCSLIVHYRPEVVLYEEALDQSVIEQAVNALMEADLLMVGGTSLNVYPAAGLLRYFSGEHLVVLNKTPTSADRHASLVIQEPIAEVLGS